MPTTAELFALLSPLLDRAMDLPPEERAAWLTQLRSQHPDLAREVEAMLAREADLDRRGFLQGDQWDLGIAPSPALAGRRIGAYTLERPVGQGGMGTVWLARRSDGRFEGAVAVKLLNLALLDPVGGERFRREGTVLARLAHPNIARLVDAGVTEGGQPFLVLEYVEGMRIDRYCDDHRLPVSRRIALFQQVLAAVAHAHANLIVHRDLKPSNILVAADGSVKLLDFGIAKLLADESSAAERTELTEAGGLPLTPEYAAPEQVTGGVVTTATDVYALGVLLYILLTARHPTGASHLSPAERLLAIVDTEPAPLRAAVPDAGDLDTILAKSLAKDPEQRYPTVAAFADDIGRYLRHEPVLARASSLGYRARKFVRRNRAAVAAAAVIAATLVSATVFSAAQMREARRQRDAALAETRRKTAMSDVQSVLAGDSRGPGGRTLSLLERIELAQQVLQRKYRREPAVVVEVMADLSARLYEVGDMKGERQVLGRARAIALEAGLPAQLALVDCLRSASYTYDGQLDSARLELSEARPALARAGDGFRFVEVACLDAEGELLVAMQRPDSGIAVLRQALALVGEDADASDRQEILNDLSSALREVGRTREAIRYRQEILAELDAAGYMETDILPSVLSFLASSLSELGEFRVVDSIVGIYVRRLEAERGRGEVGGIIAALYGVNLLRLGELDSAETWLRRAAEDSSEARRAVAMWLPAPLLQLRLEQGRRAEARGMVKELPDGTPGRLVTRALLTAGLRRAEGDARAGWAIVDSALSSAGSARLPAYLALALVTAAEWHLDEGRAHAADSVARLAIAAAAPDSMSLRRSGYVGRAELVRARAALSAGDRIASTEAARRALVALENGYGVTHPRTNEARHLRDSISPS